MGDRPCRIPVPRSRNAAAEAPISLRTLLSSWPPTKMPLPCPCAFILLFTLPTGGRRVGVPQGPSEPKGEKCRYIHHQMELGELRVRKGKRVV